MAGGPRLGSMVLVATISLYFSGVVEVYLLFQACNFKNFILNMK